MTISLVLLYFTDRQVKLIMILKLLWKMLSKILAKLIKNPFVTVALGFINAKSQTRFKNDKKSYKRSKVDILKCIHGLHQLINELTYLIDSSSCCNQTLTWSLVFNPLFIQIAIISSHLLISIYPSIILELMKEKHGTTTERMLILSGGQLTCLNGMKYYTSMMWINKLLFSVTLWWT